MKTITLNIDDKSLETLLNRMWFEKELEGCFNPTSFEHQLFQKILEKISQGQTSIDLVAT